MLSKKAAELFAEGYNCAQSVLMTVCRHWGIRSDVVPEIATPFGAGIGRCGSVCGALTGGIMAIGARFGTDEPSVEKRLKSYELGRRLYKKFENKHGSVLCRELIGYDLSSRKELDKAYQANVFEERCPTFVRMVVEELVGFGREG